MSFDERVARALAAKKATFDAETAERLKTLQALQRQGRERSLAEWDGFREMLRNTELGGGMSFEERVQLALEAKQAEFRAEAAVNASALKAARQNGTLRARKEWDEFRAMLMRTELGGGLSFSQRIAKNTARKKQEFDEDAAERWKDIRGMKKQGRTRSAEEWRNFKAMLLKDEIEGGTSFNERAAKQAAQKKAAFDEQVRTQTREYHQRIATYKDSLVDRPLLMHASSEHIVGVTKRPDAAARPKARPKSAGYKHVSIRTDPMSDHYPSVEEVMARRSFPTGD